MKLCNRYKLKFYYLLFLSLTIQISFAQMNKDADIEAIKAKRQASNEAIAKHDVEGIAKHWLTDFVQVRGNGSYLTGKDTIIAEWQRTFNQNPAVVFVRTPSEILVSDNDTLAWESGHWTGLHTYSKGGKYAAMWKKTNGAWLLQSEIFVALRD